MTPASKRIAGALSVVEALWVFHAVLSSSAVGCTASSCLGPSINPLVAQLALVVGVLLLFDGVLGFWGAWFAFPVGLVLSLVLLASSGYTYWLLSGYSTLQSQSGQALIGVAVAVIGVAGNALAMRAKTVVPEEANPMNLPVFG